MNNRALKASANIDIYGTEFLLSILLVPGVIHGPPESADAAQWVEDFFQLSGIGRPLVFGGFLVSDQVMAIIDDLKTDRNDWGTRKGLIDAAAKMPPNLARRIVDKIDRERWLDEPYTDWLV